MTTALTITLAQEEWLRRDPFLSALVDTFQRNEPGTEWNFDALAAWTVAYMNTELGKVGLTWHVETGEIRGPVEHIDKPVLAIAEEVWQDVVSDVLVYARQDTTGAYVLTAGADR